MGLAFVFLVALTFGVGVGLLGGKSQLLFLQDTALGRWVRAEGLWDRAHRWAGVHLLVAALAAIGYHQALERLAGVVPEESSPVAIVALLVLIASALCFTGLRALRHVTARREAEAQQERRSETAAETVS